MNAAHDALRANGEPLVPGVEYVFCIGVRFLARAGLQPAKTRTAIFDSELILGVGKFARPFIRLCDDEGTRTLIAYAAIVSAVPADTVELDAQRDGSTSTLESARLG